MKSSSGSPATDDEDRLACPHCGEDDVTKFQVLERGELCREVVGFKDGRLAVESEYSVADEGGDDVRFFCTACDKEFPIPDAVEIDYI